jgi:hypothetical protein
LPDKSLQAQYAHQLRLLQEEYATKAAKAEESRRRSLESNKVVSGPATAYGKSQNASPAVGREAAYGAQEMVSPPRGRVNLDSTPPSSSGGSTGGHRVAFFEGVKVIAQEEEMGTTGAEHAERDAAGYVSWDGGWNSVGDDDVTESVYPPSTGVDVELGGIVERRGDSELSPGTETSNFEDGGGSDIGDRGHDDTTRSTRRRGDIGQPPLNRNLLQGSVPPRRVDHLPSSSRHSPPRTIPWLTRTDRLVQHIRTGKPYRHRWRLCQHALITATRGNHRPYASYNVQGVGIL